ncbi:MAG: N-acetylmuramoyl-L-alanine amidase-like domain-containing protein [Thermodesulfovibrionia bacterium]
MKIILGKWTRDKLNHLIGESTGIKHAGERIDFLSRNFLDMDYRESTLIGDADTPEAFVINLKGVDCFTFIDYIEAMRISRSFADFKENLKKIRYREGRVSYKNRNHFFTDWRKFNSGLVHDCTEQTGKKMTRGITKLLNYREDGMYFLQGIEPVQREIQYIPSHSIDDSVIKKIKTGDYAGIYSEKEGLDVSHVGIIIKGMNSIYLRHASSEKKHRKVIDQDFKSYISGTPGLILLRPKKLRG